MSGLAAKVTLGSVGIGGTVSGLAAKVTLGSVGIGGTVSGLAAKVTLGSVGIGGTVSGLAAKVTLGSVGIGGTVSGLATIYVATAAIAKLRTKPRAFNELDVMNVLSLRKKERCKARLPQKSQSCYHKSGISGIIFLAKGLLLGREWE